MRVVVVGGGKMGLPLACLLAHNGADVTVCDINAKLVQSINDAKPPFSEPGLEELLVEGVKAGRLRADTNTAAAAKTAEVIIIIVPALLTPERDADLSNLKNVSRAIAGGLQPGTLVSYETTVPLGTCRRELIPLLEAGGRRAGHDVFVCFSPERVKSRTVFQSLSKTPKVVGGFDKASADRAEAFYHRYLGVEIFNMGSLEGAEMVKLAGMVYRDLNIALANELAALCEEHGLNAWDIIAAANTDGETYMLQPGIGVGGHCTPVYPYFLITRAKRLGKPLRLIPDGRQTNEEQPARNIERLASVLGGSLSGKRIHILGLAFRLGVKEHMCSPAFSVHDELVKQGAVVSLEDPMYSNDELVSLGFSPAVAGRDRCDAVVLVTGHPSFAGANFEQWHQQGVRAVLDGRHFWDAGAQRAMDCAGITYICVGRGEESAAGTGYLLSAPL